MVGAVGAALDFLDPFHLGGIIWSLEPDAIVASGSYSERSDFCFAREEWWVTLRSLGCCAGKRSRCHEKNKCSYGIRDDWSPAGCGLAHVA
jgi:hypothetical protein